MIFETLTTLSMAGVLGASYYHRNNNSIKDSDKIIKIAENCGLYKKNEKIRLYRASRDKEKKFTEYVFKIPLGMELEDFLSNKGKFIDGLNNKSTQKINLKDFKNIKFRADILKQIRKIILNREPLNKQIEIVYDGMLIIRVFDQGLPSKYPLTHEIIEKAEKWHVPIGVTLNGQVSHCFESASHLLIGGATDMGKSNILNIVITTLLKNHPEEVHFSLIDLKGGLEFGVYEHCKQVKNFATNVEEAKEALENVKIEMEKIFDELRAKGKKNVKALGRKQRHFLIIDESAELSSAGETDKEIKELKIECENLIKDIARRGRASGIKILYCTQHPTTETVSSQVKRNLITRICLPVDTSIASNVVLDEGGAEKLPLIQGRAIYKKNRCQTMQAYFIDDDIIEEVVTPHIFFHPRSDNQNASQKSKETEKGRKYTTLFEETGLSQQKPTTKATWAKK